MGRCRGSLARQCSIIGRTVGGTRSRLGAPCTTRYRRAAVVPVPNGPSPVAANASTAPRLKMSLDGPTSEPIACSGDMNPGDPTTRPACVSMVDSVAREMPKSMTRGPSSASSTFDGLRSRCTTPTAWIALRLSASPAASASSDASGSGPCVSTASASEGPGTYAVAIHATGPSTSASTTWAVNTPLTRRAAATSRPKRARNSGFAASSARMAFTATGRPPGETPRNTRPMPPWPSCPTSRYGPIDCGSSGCSSLANAKTPTTFIEVGPFSLRSRQDHDKYVMQEKNMPRTTFPGDFDRPPSSPGRAGTRRWSGPGRWP